VGHQWYYTTNGTQRGPVSGEELNRLARNGQLKAGDLVWRDGMPDWIPLGQAKELFAAESVTTPPPLPPEARSKTRPPTGIAVQDSPLEGRDGEPADWQKLGLWRFGVVYAAVVVTFVVLGICGGLLGKLAPENAGKSVPWEGLAAFACIFAVAAGLAVCVLPVAAGHVWKSDSEYLGRWGGREFRVYLPKSFAGWVGYYFATGLTGACCLIVGLALLVILLMPFATRPCRYCRAEIPATSPVCPNCRSVNP
jgi:hypothetical protein